MLPAGSSLASPHYRDVNQDGLCTAEDVLSVITYINANGSGPIPSQSVSRLRTVPETLPRDGLETSELEDTIAAIAGPVAPAWEPKR